MMRASIVHIKLQGFSNRANLLSTQPLMKCPYGIAPISFRHSTCSAGALIAAGHRNKVHVKIEWSVSASGDAKRSTV